MADDPAAGTVTDQQSPADVPSQGENAAASPAAEQHGESTAASPPASDQGDTRESLLDVVQQAVTDGEPRSSQREEPPAEGASPAPGAQSDPTAPSPQPDDLDPTAEELATYHPKTKRQIERLLEQRRVLNAEV